MQMNILFYISAFLTGILASMGLGGGMILILYMTLIAGMEQLTAQGVNLLFFIPIAAFLLWCHSPPSFLIRHPGYAITLFNRLSLPVIVI